MFSARIILYAPVAGFLNSSPGGLMRTRIVGTSFLTMILCLLSAVAWPINVRADSLASSAPSAPGADTSGDYVCTPLREVGSTNLASDGSQPPAATATTGTIHQYDLGGSIMTSRTPPSNWRAASASDKELQLYGLPPRPDEPTKLAHWNATWGQLTHSPGSPCRTNISNYKVTTTGSGLFQGAATGNEATLGEYYQAGFVYNCSSASGYSSWTGFGGIQGYPGSNVLVQAGSAATLSGGINDITPWWQAIQTGYNTLQVNFAGAGYIVPGDGIGAMVQYDPVGQTLNFTVSNFRSGAFWTTGPMATILGRPASTYMDPGRQITEYVDERPSNSLGQPYQLRKTTNGGHSWSGALFQLSNGAWVDATTGNAYDFLQMYNGANLLSLPGLTQLHPTSFFESWVACS